MDYESLIPYMNESIRANFNDLKDIKSKNEALKQALDQIYEQFVERSKKQNNALEAPGGGGSKLEGRMHPAWKGLIAIFTLAVALVVSLAVISFMEKIKDKNSPDMVPISPSIPAPFQNQPIPLLPSPPGPPTTEQYRVLKELYEATDGTNWFNNTNWLSLSVSECQWYGLQCAPNLGNVNLGGNNLRGTIPTNLGRLQGFVSFDFSNNSLHGTIPTSFSWIRLFSLQLQDNQLSGTIAPEIFAGNTLATFNVANNRLSGTLPAGIGSTLAIQQFLAAHNQLTGTIPPFQAFWFDVSYNLLEGSLPQIATSMFPLDVYNVAHNNLSGDVSVLGNLTAIAILNISHNNLAGTLSLSPSQLQSLYTLDASYTLLDGIAETPSVPAKLATCNMTHVPLKCPIPAWAAKCNAVCT